MSDGPVDGDGSTSASRGVVRSYLAISGLYTLSASLIWGINTLFLLDAGLDILEVFVVNAVFTGSMAAFEIPTGVLADTRGRRASFLLSVVIVLVGTLGYVGVAHWGGGVWAFAWVSVVLGLGYTFYSGAVEAWLVDALQDAGSERSLDRVFARGGLVSGAAMLVGTTGGGLLGTLDYAVPFLVRAGLLAVVFGVAWIVMRDRGFTPRSVGLRGLPGEMRRVATASIRHGWQKRPIRWLVVASLVQSLFMAWGFYAWAPYFLGLLGRDAAWVAGVIAAAISLATMCGNVVVEWFTRYCGRRTTLLVWAIAIQSAAAVGVGLTGSFWVAVGLYLVVMAAGGAYGPVKQGYLHQVVASEQRATVISFDALVASGGSMVGQTGLGYLARRSSLAMGYVVGGLLTLASAPAVLALRRLGGEADRIVGQAGKAGACGAQGLPDVAALDSVPRVPTEPESATVGSP